MTMDPNTPQPVPPAPPAPPQPGPTPPEPQPAPEPGPHPDDGGQDAEPAPPVVTPTDYPPPPGPQPIAQQNMPTIIGPSNVMASRDPEDNKLADDETASAFMPDGTPVDRTHVVRAMVKNPNTGQDMEVTAAATRPEDVARTASHDALNIAGEMGAAGVVRTLSPQPQQFARPIGDLIDRWLDSAVHKRFASSIGRGPQDLGLVGRGHVVTGHMILMDADTGELHRVMPGTRIDEDKIYVNTRNLPEWLVNNPKLATGGGGHEG